MNNTHTTTSKRAGRRVCHSLRLLLTGLMVMATLPILQAAETEQQTADSGATGTGKQGYAGTFEGTMRLSMYAVSAEGEEQLRSRYHMLVHSDYLRLAGDGEGTFQLMGAVSTEGVIVRQEQEQIVFLTRDKQALVMSHTELRQMLAMMDQLRGAASPTTDESAPVISRSGEHEMVQGYHSERWKAAVPGHSAEWRIWVTDQVQVPWGMLAETWLLERVFPPDLPVAEWMRQGLMPLKAEMWNGGMLVQTVRFEQITPENLTAGHFVVPEGYASMTFQQLLFGQMRNRQ